MTDAKHAWDQVGDRLEALALKLKLHLEQETSEHTEEDEERGSEVVDALDRLGEAFEDVFGAVENAARDQGIRSDVAEAASATGAALTATFGEVTAGLKERLGR